MKTKGQRVMKKLQPRADKPSNQVDLVKVAQQVFGITDRRYRQLADEGIVPRPEKGNIDFVAATKALIEYYRKLAEADGSLSLQDERTRWTGIKADIAALELERTKGNLVDRQQAIAWLCEQISNATMSFKGLARRLAPSLAVITDEKELEEQLRKEIKSIIDRLVKNKHEKKQSRAKGAA